MKVQQRYRNDTGKNLETVYTFPLAWGATLLGLNVEIAGKRLQATVIEKKKATKKYEKAIDDGRFYDFFTDHVNYFSLHTLGLAMAHNGFRVIDSSHGMFDEYNVLLVQAVQLPSLTDVQQAVSDLGGDLRAFLVEERRQGRKVCIWGAGGKGLSVLATTGIDSVDLMVDSDPFKQGLYTPVSHLLVDRPTREALSAIDVVVITAMAYRQEIERDLRSVYGFKGRVAVIGHRLEVSAETSAVAGERL